MQPRHLRIIFALTFVTLLGACSRDGREMQEPSANQQESIAVTTTAGAVMTPVGGFALTPPWAEGAQLDALDLQQVQPNGQHRKPPCCKHFCPHTVIEERVNTCAPQREQALHNEYAHCTKDRKSTRLNSSH